MHILFFSLSDSGNDCAGDRIILLYSTARQLPFSIIFFVSSSRPAVIPCRTVYLPDYKKDEKLRVYHSMIDRVWYGERNPEE